MTTGFTIHEGRKRGIYYWIIIQGLRECFINKDIYFHWEME
jgi:hypothetical protein